jgi:hypothetical protein
MSRERSRVTAATLIKLASTITPSSYLTTHLPTTLRRPWGHRRQTINVDDSDTESSTEVPGFLRGNNCRQVAAAATKNNDSLSAGHKPAADPNHRCRPLSMRRSAEFLAAVHPPDHPHPHHWATATTPVDMPTRWFG